MKLQHYTNNAYDSIVLVNSNDEIIGAWANVEKAVEDFYATEGGDPSDWEANYDDWRPECGIDELVATIAADGTMVAVDASLMAKRMEFWGVAKDVQGAGGEA